MKRPTWGEIVSSKAVGAVALDITERLDKPRSLKLTVYQVSQEPQVVKVPITVIERAPMILKIELVGAA
jgi:hypothetical protein